jgi:hypothetical protein
MARARTEFVADVVNLSAVIAGLDPAIHEAVPQARM